MAFSIFGIGRCSQADYIKELKPMVNAFSKNVKTITNVKIKVGVATKDKQKEKAQEERDQIRAFIAKHKDKEISEKHKKKAGHQKFDKYCAKLSPCLTTLTTQEPTVSRQRTQKFHEEQWL